MQDVYWLAAIAILAALGLLLIHLLGAIERHDDA
jgi:hypothetical protein